MLGQLAVILLVVVVVKSDEQCSPETFQNCLQDAAREVSSQPLPGFPDEAFLNKYCRPVIETAECGRDAARRCPHVGAVAEHIPTFDAIVDLLHSVCDEGSEVKEGYVANVDCYNRSLPQMKECVDRVQNLIDTFFEEDESETELPMFAQRGCLFNLMAIKCVIKVSTASCGTEGTVALVNIMDQLSAIRKAISCHDDTLVLLEARFLTYMEEIGYELKKRRK